MFLLSLLFLVGLMFLVSMVASRRVETMSDYVLAGQQFGFVVSTCALVSTWYGAESLMTLADEVRRVGVSCIWIDPIGVSFCLLLAGVYVVPKLYNRSANTIGDLFREAGGQSSEIACCLIVVPSYFGWLAAQMIALSLLFQNYLGTSFGMGITLSLIIASILCIWGGNESVGWVNTLLLFVIVVGLVALVLSIARDGVWFRDGTWQITPTIPRAHFSLEDPESRSPLLSILGAVAIGSIGNLPAIELIQRIRSAKNQTVARWACMSAAFIYLGMGIIPVFLGLSYVAHGWSSASEELQVISSLAKYHLSLPFQVLFFLSIVATILSTLVSASVSPATMLGMSFIEPILIRLRGRELTERTRLSIQRICVVVMLLLGTLLALSGETAFQLVRDSYGLLLAAIVVPFLAILFCKRPPNARAINVAMVTGTLLWATHWMLDQKYFATFLFPESLEMPHELADAAGCLFVFGIFNIRVKKWFS